MGSGNAGHRPFQTSHLDRLWEGKTWVGFLGRGSGDPETTMQDQLPPVLCSPLSQREPLHPGGQRQAPVTWWQGAPLRQVQRSSQ